MSTKSELKENVLASKLEVAVKWGMENRSLVLTIAGIVVAGALISSVFVLRTKEKTEFNTTRMAQVQFLVTQKKFSEADAILKDMSAAGLPGGPLQIQVPYYQGVAALGLKNYSMAQQSFQQALDRSGRSPMRPLVLANLAFSYEEAGDASQAADRYGQFLAEFGDHFMAPRIQLSLGKALLKAGKIEEGKKALDQLIDLYPTSAWAENARSIMDKYKTR